MNWTNPAVRIVAVLISLPLVLLCLLWIVDGDPFAAITGRIELTIYIYPDAGVRTVMVDGRDIGLVSGIDRIWVSKGVHTLVAHCVDATWRKDVYVERETYVSVTKEGISASD